jgi:hypothetical protein
MLKKRELLRKTNYNFIKIDLNSQINEFSEDVSVSNGVLIY